MQVKTFFFCFLTQTLVATPFTIILNPAGDAQTTGRQIYDSFERSYTYQLAQALKKRLLQELPTISVLLTRLPGETAQPLQYATFSNRIAADMYISLHCFEQDSIQSQLYLYQFSYGEQYVLPQNTLSFLSYDQAHLLNVRTTSRYANQMAKHLSRHEKSIELNGPYTLPFAPLIGITCPALGFELGLKTSSSWTEFVEPLAQAIIAIGRK